MTLREAIETLAKGYSYSMKDEARAKDFDQALDTALLAVAVHEASCAVADTESGDAQMRKFRKDYANHLFMQLRAAERQTTCSTV